MSILSGYKRFKDYLKTDTGYILTSRRTTSDAVVMGDGTDDENTVEKNLGAIKGITTSTSVTETGYAADASVVSSLSVSLGGLTFMPCTQTRYNAMETHDANTLYIIIPETTTEEVVEETTE